MANSDVTQLFLELSEAVKSGDSRAVEEAKRKILMGNRNVAVDENFMNSISGKSLFRNMRRVIKEDTSLTRNDYAKIVSSLITHSIIESEKTGIPYSEYGINEMYVFLGKLISGKEESVNEARNFISSRYSEFLCG